MWNIANIIAGACSVQLFGPRLDHRQVMAQIQVRATTDNITIDAAFKQYMKERKLGQFLMIGVCFSALAIAMIGATQEWPDLLVAPFAILPAILILVLSKLSNKRRP